MANSNKVFVSPGVYTSEKDLTFVAQSVGVTTLGLVGETLKGPAFEPILITNFDDFKTYFGSTSPEKDGSTIKNPKYELPYVAKSYLQESNQLFVTRILGLTGYKPNRVFGITTLGGINDPSSIAPTFTTGTLVPTTDPITGITDSDYYSLLSGKTSTDGTVPTFLTSKTYADNNWFTIGLVPDSGTTGLLPINKITGPIGSEVGSPWYNEYFVSPNLVYSYLFVYNYGTTQFDVTQYVYTGAIVNSTYNNLTVAYLSSRGHYSGNTLVLEVTHDSGVTITPTTGTNISSDPLATFDISITTDLQINKKFTCSMDTTNSKFITKVLGVDVFDKKEEDFPLYVSESYPKLVKVLHDRGLIRGLNVSKISYNADTEFMTSWNYDATQSPMVVSEVRGGQVHDLFQVLTISDGNAANYQIKISIVNINLETGEFDILVRDFNDTDENQVVIEKFSRCTMDPDKPGYVGLKVGTSNLEYELKSKNIMLSIADNAPSDAIPAGFGGYVSNTLYGNNGSTGTTLGNIFYKTEYYDAGNPLDEAGDKIRKVSLGVSSKIGFDKDLFKFKGVNTHNKVTPGFHLSVNASTITGGTNSGFAYDCTPYDLEGTNKGKLSDINYRKFTFAVYGGFDGWDIYRNVRTYDDSNIFGKSSYTARNQTNGGVFNDSVGNSDYYAYLEGIATFANPEAIDINVFATPGINFYDHASLTSLSIDMVETDRADSLYIIGTPNRSTVDEVVGDLDTASLDTNYSATYWPWIQIRDNDNSTQLFIPPTGEVVRNIALTDNVSYPWFAIAGYQRGLVNSVKAVKKLTADERDTLYKNRINPIATFSDTGTIIWGNKTLQVRESALDRINVRRLLLRTRKLISAVAIRLIFQQNDDEVRNEFLRLVNPILEAIKKERGLYDFRVTVSSDPEDIDANTLRGKIYIKPTRSLEFIDIEFVITPTGASFENI
jgi:hypothetical protein